MRICTAVTKNNHARSLCPRSEGFHSDVDADWSIGYWRSGCIDSWIGHGYAWAPWERDSDVMFPPVLFTLATFVATVAFCAGTVVYHTLLKSITIDADKWWRISGGVFLLAYGLYSFGSGTFQAAIMLNLLHLIVGIPALLLIPRVLKNKPNNMVQT